MVSGVYGGQNRRGGERKRKGKLDPPDIIKTLKQNHDRRYHTTALDCPRVRSNLSFFFKNILLINLSFSQFFLFIYSSSLLLFYSLFPPLVGSPGGYLAGSSSLHMRNATCLQANFELKIILKKNYLPKNKLKKNKHFCILNFLLKVEV